MENLTFGEFMWVVAILLTLYHWYFVPNNFDGDYRRYKESSNDGTPKKFKSETSYTRKVSNKI